MSHSQRATMPLTFTADFVHGKTVRSLLLYRVERNKPSPPRDCKAELATADATVMHRSLRAS
jgi:hypothetical protein